MYSKHGKREVYGMQVQPTRRLQYYRLNLVLIWETLIDMIFDAVWSNVIR